MNVRGLTPVLNVSDLEASFDWFARFGFEGRWKHGDPPDFGAVGNGTYEIFLCRECQGGRDPDHQARPDRWHTAGVWMSLWVSTPADVDAAHAHAVREGLLVTCPPEDMPWGVRECHVQHPDGHVFRISCSTAHG